MDELEEFIGKLKRLSNIEYCGSAEDMQYKLEEINDLLCEEFPSVPEVE